MAIRGPPEPKGSNLSLPGFFIHSLFVLIPFELHFVNHVVANNHDAPVPLIRI